MSLIMVSVIMLVLAAVESARVSSCVQRAESVTYMGLDSCFGMYAKEVLDEYGVMFLWSSEKDFIDDFHNVVSENCDVKRNIAGVVPVDVKIDRAEHCIDHNGQVFENQVCDYMKLKLGADGIKLILDKVNMLSQSDDITKMYNHISDCSREFAGAAAVVSDIAGDITDMKSKEGDLAGHINAVSGDVGCYSDYELWKNSMFDSIEKIEKDINEFHDASRKAKVSADEMLDNIEKMRGKTDDDTYSMVYAEAKEIADKFNENDSYGIGNCKEALEEQRNILKNTDTKLTEYHNNTENKQALDDAILLGKEFDISKIEIQYEIKDKGKEKNTIVKNVNNMLSSGILSLVVSDVSKVSNKNISDSNLPSKNISDIKYKKSLKKQLIFDQYILDFFGSYGDEKKDTALDYEIEYIINGKEKDSENLSMTAEKIVAIRSGFNIISIIKDEAKMEETLSLATAVAGISGSPLVIKLTQLGIIAAWASAESVADVKNLMNQKKVALIKDASQWNLSLSGLMKMDSVTKKDDDTGGLSYKDYLRYLLSAGKHVICVNRTMDVIELNMKKKYNPNFRIADCISKVEITCVYNAKKMFFAFGNKKFYEIKVSQKYEY